MMGEKQYKERGLQFRNRVCRRCGKFYLSFARRGKYCEKCKKPLKKQNENKSNSEKGEILDGV